MKTVIVDNEKNAADYLKELLETFSEITIERVFYDSVEAMAYLTKNPCDVIFLDIEMPSINGIYIAEEVSLLFPETKICFITAYQQFAAKAFELNAIDYIVKPYSRERLEQALHKVGSLNETSYSILSTIDQQENLQLDIICGYDEDEINLLSYHDIYYIEADGRYLWIHTREKKYRGNKTLNYYEEKLKRNSFFRSYKSILVNMEKLSKLRPRINYTYDILFHDIDDIVPISRTKVKQLKEYLE